MPAGQRPLPRHQVNSPCSGPYLWSASCDGLEKSRVLFPVGAFAAWWTVIKKYGLPRRSAFFACARDIRDSAVQSVGTSSESVHRAP